MSAAGATDQPALVKTLEVIGSAPIAGQDIVQARDQAITESLVVAVQQAAGEVLEADLRVNRFATLNEILFDASSEYVHDYKVLAEARSGKSYRVLVQATVSLSRIKDQLSRAGVLKARSSLPRVLLLVMEADAPAGLPGDELQGRKFHAGAVAESVMADVMRSKGYTVITPQSSDRSLEAVSLVTAQEISLQKALALGARLQSEVVVIGRASSRKSTNANDSSAMSFRGNVEAMAYFTETGAFLAETNQQALTVGSDEVMGTRDALSGAGSLAGEELSAQIMEAWQRSPVPADHIEVVIEGAGYLSSLVKIRTSLQGMARVESVQTREMKATEATLMVEFQGTAKELAEALVTQPFEAVRLNIYEVSPERVRIALTPG